MVAKKRNGKLGAAVLTLFALPFAAAGVAVLYLACAGLWTWHRMSYWVPVPAELLSVTLEENRGDDSTTYRVAARYRYSYDGRDYVNDRVAITRFSDNIGDFHQRLYRELDAARTRSQRVTAYVDPDDPQDATLNRELRTMLTLLMLVFGLVFGGVGFGLMAGARIGARKLAAQRRLQERFPNQPWRWRPDWNEGRIKGSSRRTAYVAAGFAVLWNLISLPAAVAAPRELERGNWAVLIALLFPAVGVGLAVWAVRSWRRLRRFKESTLILDDMPVSLGGRLRGTVSIGAAVPVESAFEIELNCVERTRSRGRNRRSTERLLWQETWTVPKARCQLSATYSTVPVDIPLPDDQPPSSTDEDERRIFWRLEVAGECSGPDYLSRFEIPVFATSTVQGRDAARFGLDTGSAASERAAERPDARALEAMGIVWESAPGGREAWTFKRARHKSVAVGLTVFMAAWTAVVGVLLVSDAPRLFPIVFGLVDALFVWWMLNLWLVEYRIVVRGDTLILERRGLGRRKREIPRGRIARVSARRGMRAGDKLYYDLRVDTLDKHTYTAASALGDYAVARWLAEHLMGGVTPPHSSVSEAGLLQTG